MNFKEKLNLYTTEIEDYLNNYLNNLTDNRPEKNLISAMRYSLMAGGKRIRPALALAVADLLDYDRSMVMPFAAAIEMIHTYSLIHDDLPAMDNDDLRRGKPTCHKVYGEALAILAGDALLNDAFELMLKTASESDECKNLIEASFLVAKASGKEGMIAGQVVDMESEGSSIPYEILKYMHSKKTGALLKVSLMASAVALNASSDAKKALSDYADNIGIAFQIKDDILDVESTTQELGKPVGSDNKNEKTTFVSLFGIGKSKEMLKEVTQSAVTAISIFSDKSWFLKETALYIADRNN